MSFDIPDWSNLGWDSKFFNATFQAQIKSPNDPDIPTIDVLSELSPGTNVFMAAAFSCGSGNVPFSISIFEIPKNCRLPALLVSMRAASFLKWHSLFDFEFDDALSEESRGLLKDFGVACSRYMKGFQFFARITPGGEGQVQYSRLVNKVQRGGEGRPNYQQPGSCDAYSRNIPVDPNFATCHLLVPKRAEN
ncbi:hypothetical protein C8R44DRAFT_736239 [Mycena epipterygia]|nr:hypothetical protein C8R44DRAFT_736239 [Mycena epipterygia]